MPLPVATCAWDIDVSCAQDEWDDVDSDVQDRAIQLASATLRRLTGYRVGGCPITVRPCKPGCNDGFMAPWRGSLSFLPVNLGGVWVNSCGHTTDCSCGPLCEIVLPGPVGRVDAVNLDGDLIPSEDYRLDGTRLVSLAETCPWPSCQDMSLPDTEPGTFSVTYLNSYPVDVTGAYAAGVLAVEFARACTGSNKCRLPKGVTAISRQGISIQMVSGAFPDGLTGIKEVDAFTALWNPGKLRQPSTVFSPDMVQPRIVGA